VNPRLQPASIGKLTNNCDAFFAPADPAFGSGIEFYGLADFVEAAVLSDNAEAGRAVIDEIERVSAPTPVPWIETMLHFGKALLAPPEDAEQFFLRGMRSMRDA
jgi:hypothetical protein